MLGERGDQGFDAGWEMEVRAESGMEGEWRGRELGDGEDGEEGEEMWLMRWVRR